MTTSSPIENFNILELPRENIIELLETFIWANYLTTSQIKTLADFIQTYKVSAGTIISKEGETQAFLCLLYEGSVDVIKEDGFGTAKKIHTLSRGKGFGEMSFFDGGPRSASIVANEDVILLMIDRQSFLKLSETHPHIALQVAVNMLINVSQHLRQTTGKLVDFL